MKSDSLYYIHKDYLGSIETITDENGLVLEKLNFDPWGRRRDIRSWNYNPNLKSQYFDRGYTMHEHLDLFGLINMNGRLYDPMLGRMLSPDAFVQDPTNLQNYNRYSYALNNPLKYVDPSGYHHASVFKPGDWDAGMGSGGALYINTSFTNDFNGNPFGSYEQRHTYNYDNSTGTWTNGVGQQVSPLEVNANTNWTQEEFSNFVENNSTALPTNTDLNSIEAKDGGYQFFTIDPTSSPLWNSSTSEVNLHFIRGGKDQAGGGDMTNNQFSGSEKAALGLAATSGSINLTTGLIDKLSETVKNADVVNFGKSVTKKFGFVGVGMTTYNSFSDGTLTVGDGARILMSGVTFIPYAGWIYGAIDMGVLLTTGTSATDRIGNYVDVHWGPGPIRP